MRRTWILVLVTTACGGDGGAGDAAVGDLATITHPGDAVPDQQMADLTGMLDMSAPSDAPRGEMNLCPATIENGSPCATPGLQCFNVPGCWYGGLGYAKFTAHCQCHDGAWDCSSDMDCFDLCPPTCYWDSTCQMPIPCSDGGRVVLDGGRPG